MQTRTLAKASSPETKKKSGTTPFFQPKLTVNTPGDAHEREADQVADQVMRMKEDEEPVVQRKSLTPVSSVQRMCADCEEKQEGKVQRQEAGSGSRGGQTAPSIVGQVLSSGGGRPMDRGTQQFMESRFGQDFGQVRIHTGGQAAESASAIQAKAYTSGRDIVFGEGAYRPESGEGKKLLAHELVHVGQQGGTNNRTIHRKKTPAPFYQEVLDRIEKEEKSLVRSAYGTTFDILKHLPELKKLLNLAKAVDEEKTMDIPDLISTFLTMDVVKLRPYFPSKELMSLITVRLSVLGMEEESRKLTQWYASAFKDSWGSADSGFFRDNEHYFWQTVVEDLEKLAPPSTLLEGKKIVEGSFVIFRLIKQKLDEIKSKDLDDQLRSRAMRTDYANLVTGFGMSPHDNSILAFHGWLTELISRLLILNQIAFQKIMDSAIQDLEAGKGPTALDVAKDVLENRFAKMIDPERGKETQDAISKRQTGVVVDVSKSLFHKKKSTHIDFFAKNPKTAPNVAINLYDVTDDITYRGEMQMSMEQIYVIRKKQIFALEQIYGIEKTKNGKLSKEAKTNADTIQQLRDQKGQLKLHSNEDWRKFVLAKFEKHLASGLDKAKALDAVINLLELYLNAFTTHTPLNIDDFGDNQLKKTFPRVLSGQLIHDCGVYALRIAYILSLIREHPELKLRFRFVLLPVHIGLIITGENLPTYIIHNDRVRRFSAEDMKKLKVQWSETNEKGDERKTPVQLDENQFLGEIAAQKFIERVNMPFMVMEVPHISSKDKKASEELWNFYRTKVVKHNSFSKLTQDPKSPYYQYHLKYLHLLEIDKKFHNEALLPFWNNELRKIFEKHKEQLTKTWSLLQTISNRSQGSPQIIAFRAVRNKYEIDMINALTNLNNLRNSFTSMQIDIPQIEQDLSAQIEQDKAKILSKGALLAFTPRTENLLGSDFWWEGVVFDHLRAMGDSKSVVTPTTIFNNSFKKLEPLM